MVSSVFVFNLVTSFHPKIRMGSEPSASTTPVQAPFKPEDLSWGGSNMVPPSPSQRLDENQELHTVQSMTIPDATLDDSSKSLEDRLRVAAQSGTRLASAQAAMTDDQIRSALQQIEASRLEALRLPPSDSKLKGGRASSPIKTGGSHPAPLNAAARERSHRMMNKAASAITAALSTEGGFHGDLLSQWMAWRDDLIDRGAPGPFNPQRMDAWIAGCRANVPLSKRQAMTLVIFQISV